MKEGFKHWFRWIAVLPGALISGFLATFPLHLILYFTLTEGSIIAGINTENIERLLTPFVIASVFVWMGSRIAPSHKFKTSIFLFGFWLCLLGIITFLTISGYNLMGKQLYFQFSGIGSLLSVVGAFIGLYIVKIEEEKKLSETLEKYPNIVDMTGKDGITAFQIGGCPPSRIKGKPEEK